MYRTLQFESLLYRFSATLRPKSAECCFLLWRLAIGQEAYDGRLLGNLELFNLPYQSPKKRMLSGIVLHATHDNSTHIYLVGRVSLEVLNPFWYQPKKRHLDWAESIVTKAGKDGVCEISTLLEHIAIR